jgi:DNA-directed RNA polymerase specialized sigma subunit
VREFDKIAAECAHNKDLLNSFIGENERFILNITSKATRKYITKSDDEYSVSLFAFRQAVEKYSFEKGSFLSFAEMVIRRKLVDYIRSQKKYTPEVPIDPVAFSSEPENDEESDGALKNEIAEKIAVEPDDSLKLEIEAAGEVFASYGFSFFDLADCSPHADKTRTACAKAAAYLLKNPTLLRELKSSKMLPIKIIEKNCGVPRKILERHRKYIIAAVEIISGDYPYLAEYMHFIRKEADL